MNPKVFKVEGYSDREGLARVVSAALGMAAPALEAVRQRGTEALVVIKPNWVQESHEYQPETWEPVITHPTVILAVVREVATRLPEAAIVICDAPHTYASFEAITGRGAFRSALKACRAEFPKVRIELLDLRREVWRREDQVVVERIPNAQDPNGYVALDLSRDSLFYRHPGEGRYYGADYDSGVVNAHHCGERQEYLLAGTPMHCDLFINLPKMKTHKKTGLTCSLKNLVGINGDKNWLPHHTEGGPQSGGDEFASETARQRLERRIKKVGRKVAISLPLVGSWLYRKARNAGIRVLGDSETVVRNGNWKGNDTCWRMALDLNRALLYGNMDGSWRERGAAKPYLTIVDGIIGGEGNGPLCPDAVASGVMVVGTDAGSVDATVARLMGFDPVDLPLVRESFAPHRWPVAPVALEALEVDDERLGRTVPVDQLAPAVSGGFKPHFGWVELARS